jgi:putative ABC transport system ATP-binding protein
VDRGNQQHIIDLIRESCRQENVALVLVTHSDEVAGQFDRVDRLDDINRVAGRRSEAAASGSGSRPPSDEPSASS